MRPTAKLGGDSAGTGAPISLGAVLDVRKGGKHFDAAAVAQLLLDRTTRRSGAISRFFEGEATSEVDVRWGLHARLLAGGAAGPRRRSTKPIREADTQVRRRSPATCRR